MGVTRQSLLLAAEPLWIASLGAQFIVLGGTLLPRIIRLLGRGGAAETVEWAIYMSMLFVFPPLVWFVGWGLPRMIGSRGASSVKRGLVVLLAMEFVIYAGTSATPSLVFAALAAAVGAIVVWRSRGSVKWTAVTGVLAAGCGTAGWMAGGSLVYWRHAVSWLAASPMTIVAFVASAALAVALLERWARDDEPGAIGALDLVPIGILVAFSFRTFPMVEFYHWGFFIGPIEQLRQGGTLLWDTPSQYGFLSIFLPALLPGSAWQSFWFFQSLVYAIVASMMYLSIRRLAAGWYCGAAAFFVTLTVLFFRPRTEALILPAQMTPAAGPFRFIWCFAMLAFLVSWHTGTRKNESRARFAIIGTGIWAVALLWSAETAIYVTAMWFPALLIHSLQDAVLNRLPVAATIGRVLKAAVYPLGGALVAGAIVLACYSAAGAPGPDIFGHFEYVLLYSKGGFGALPIDPTGTVWYLILSFLIVSTIFGLHARRNPRDPRLVVWAAASGGIWAISSYFTGRSHPVNLIALTPLLIFTLIACLRMRPFGDSLNARHVLAASILPLLVMPATLTAGHRSFVAAMLQSQLPPARFEEQVPAMDPELQTLLAAAGAGHEDAFVLASDGRLMLEAWRTGGGKQLSTRSWLPKAFEIVGSLPENRRQVYLARNATRIPAQSWLIQSKKLVAHGSDHLMRFLETGGYLGKRLESANWIVTRIEAARIAGE